MQDIKLHKIEISENFLKHINKLTKMSIKVYLSLAYIKHKRGDFFNASHKEISINFFKDDDSSSQYFGVRTDQSQYFKAFKQLEALNLIEVHRSKTKNGGNKINKYKVY